MARRKKVVAKSKQYIIRRLVVIIGSLFVIAAITVAALLIFSNPNPLAAEPLPFSASSKHLFTGSGFLYIQETTLNYLSLSGKESENYSLDLQSADVNLAAGPNIGIVYSGYSMQIIGSSESQVLPGAILDIRCGEDYIAVLTLNEAQNSVIMIYTKAGAPADSIEISGIYLNNFGFYKVGATSMLWTQTTETSESLPLTTVTTYDLKKAATTGIITLQSQLMDSLYTTQNSIYIAGTNHIISYDHIGNTERGRIQIYGYSVLDYTSSGSKPLFLLESRDPSQKRVIKLCSVTEDTVIGGTFAMVRLPEGTICSFVAGNTFYALTPAELISYNSAGKQQAVKKLEFTADSAQKLSDALLLINAGGSMRLMPIG